MNNKVKMMVICSMFACITAIGGQIKIDLPSLVPITMQTCCIYMMGLYLDKKYAFFASLIYVLMGAVGLPVFSGFTGGIGILIGPVGGYIFSFPIMAFIIAWIIEKKDDVFGQVIALIIGTVICYSIGTAWFMFINNLDFFTTLSFCVVPFIPGDVLKIIISLVIIKKIKKNN